MPVALSSFPCVRPISNCRRGLLSFSWTPKFVKSMQNASGWEIPQNFCFEDFQESGSELSDGQFPSVVVVSSAGGKEEQGKSLSQGTFVRSRNDNHM